MTTILDPALDLSLAPLTNTPLTSSATTFELADLAGDIANFPDPGVLGYYAWVWARQPSFPNVGDANRAGFAERVRVTARDLGLQTLTVTRGVSPIDLNVAGTTYWLVAPMNAAYIDDLDDRIFDFVGGNLVTTKDVQLATLFAEQVDLAVTTPGVGLLRFLEDTANGTSAVTLQSPAALAGDVAMTLPSVLPAGLEFMQLDAAGLITTTPSSSTVTLDDAYDQGGAGAGRVIVADTGPVEATTDGFQSTGLPAVYLYETTDASFNFRTAATANDLLFQRGDQDTDVSDDTFETIFAIDGVTRRVGTNTTNPQDLLHINAVAAGAARLRVQALDVTSDVSVLYNQSGSNIWEAGYDDSAAGFVIGRLTFANPAFFVADTTGRVGVGTVSLGVNRMEILTSGNEVGLKIDSSGNANDVTLDLVPDIVSLHQHGDLRMGQRAANPINPINGEIWYNHGKRRFEFMTGIFSGLTGAITTDNRAQRKITTGGVLNAGSAAQGNLFVEAFSGSTDDLDTITAEDNTNGPYYDGDIVVIQAFTSHTITVTQSGNIRLNSGATKVLVSKNRLMLHYDSADNLWYQISTMQVLS